MDCNHTAVRNSGLTLIELLIVLTITTIVLTQAVPSFFSLIRSTTLSAQKNKFVHAMHYARSEAIKQNRPVLICASNGQVCSEVNQWEEGWIVYVDRNGNSLIEDDEVLRNFETISNAYTLRSNTNSHTLQFLADGRARKQSGALPMMTFDLCAPDAKAGYMAQRSFELIINATGRLRIQPGKENATDCPAA